MSRGSVARNSAQSPDDIPERVQHDLGQRQRMLCKGARTGRVASRFVEDQGEGGMVGEAWLQRGGRRRLVPLQQVEREQVMLRRSLRAARKANWIGEPTCRSRSSPRAPMVPA